MKKSIKVVTIVLAVVFVFAFASTAFAAKSPTGYGYRAWGESWTLLNNLTPPAGAYNYSNHARLVQHYMNYRYYDLTGTYPKLSEDGQYGAKTQQRVISFQSQTGLDVDGYTGPATWAKMCAQTYDVAVTGGRMHFGARKYRSGALTTSCVGMNASANYNTGEWETQPYWQNAWGEKIVSK